MSTHVWKLLWPHNNPMRSAWFLCHKCGDDISAGLRSLPKDTQWITGTVKSIWLLLVSCSSFKQALANFSSKGQRVNTLGLQALWLVSVETSQAYHYRRKADIIVNKFIIVSAWLYSNKSLFISYFTHLQNFKVKFNNRNKQLALRLSFA